MIKDKKMFLNIDITVTMIKDKKMSLKLDIISMMIEDKDMSLENTADKSFVKDVKVIGGERYIPHHKLLVCKMLLKTYQIR